MQRSDVLAIVMKNIKDNLDDLNEVIDPSRSMLDYGANSLDVVEIVSQTIRDMGIKVPRTQLMGLKTIDELVDALTEISNQSAK